MHAPRSWAGANRILLCLALGVVTTTIVAIAMAWRVSLPNGNPASRGGERLVGPGGVSVTESNGKAPANTMYFEFHTSDHIGVTFAYSRLRPFQNYTPAAPPPVSPRPEDAAHRWERARLLPWTTGDAPWPATNAREHGVHAKAAGWPLRCFWCELTSRETPSPVTHTYEAAGGVTLWNTPRPGWTDWPPDYPVVIPLRPIVPELAANSALFAGAWGVPIFGIPALRRGRRRRRGRCPGCGYDRRGLASAAACPECGAPLRTEG